MSFAILKYYLTYYALDDINETIYNKSEKPLKHYTLKAHIYYYEVILGGNFMGLVRTDIILKNAFDTANFQRGLIKEKEVREVSVRALVDTGAGTLVINEEIREKLGLEIERLRQAELADGSKQTYKVTEPVNIIWKDRDTVCRALVLPESSEVLLGAIPLEDMDLIVNPKKQELVGAHGDEVVCIVK